MKTIGEFNSNRWGCVLVQQGTYQSADGPVAIALISEDGEPLTTLSVNMYRPECSKDSKDLPSDCFYVKDYGGNEELAADAIASGLFVQREDMEPAESGFISAPVWQIVGAA